MTFWRSFSASSLRLSDISQSCSFRSWKERKKAFSWPKCLEEGSNMITGDHQIHKSWIHLPYLFDAYYGAQYSFSSSVIMALWWVLTHTVFSRPHKAKLQSTNGRYSFGWNLPLLLFVFLSSLNIWLFMMNRHGEIWWNMVKIWWKYG